MTNYATNTRTIARDLALLTEANLYNIEIRVCGGAGRVAKVDVEDFAPPPEVLDVWRSLGAKTKAPQILLFEELDKAVKTMTEDRRRIYDSHTIHLGIERVVTGSKLVEFQAAFEALQQKSEVLLNHVLTDHARAKSDWLNLEILPLLNAGNFNGADVRSRLNDYAMRFPSYERIEAKFGVQLKFNPTTSFRDLLERDIRWQQQMAERAQAEADWLQAQAQQLQITDEAMAAQRALRLQEQRLRSAIEEKVAEVQTQVLNVLRRNLQRVVDASWNSGSMPIGMQEQLRSLAESARIITQSVASFGDLGERIDAVRRTGVDRQADENQLQAEVESLLRDLDNRLQVPELTLIEGGGGIDRAYFIDFG
ncbi:MAG: hypothetical protein RLZZ511_3123 [Cyanobacteriota bacterium]